MVNIVKSYDSNTVKCQWWNGSEFCSINNLHSKALCCEPVGASSDSTRRTPRARFLAFSRKGVKNKNHNTSILFLAAHRPHQTKCHPLSFFCLNGTVDKNRMNSKPGNYSAIVKMQRLQNWPSGCFLIMIQPCMLGHHWQKSGWSRSKTRPKQQPESSSSHFKLLLS